MVRIDDATRREMWKEGSTDARREVRVRRIDE